MQEPGAPEPEIPDHELRILLDAVAEAVDLAGAGQVLDGFRCLLGGKERAQEAVEFGDPWGPELLARYERALLRYAEEYGVQP